MSQIKGQIIELLKGMKEDALAGNREKLEKKNIEFNKLFGKIRKEQGITIEQSQIPEIARDKCISLYSSVETFEKGRINKKEVDSHKKEVDKAISDAVRWLRDL